MVVLDLDPYSKILKRSAEKWVSSTPIDCSEKNWIVPSFKPSQSLAVALIVFKCLKFI